MAKKKDRKQARVNRRIARSKAILKKTMGQVTREQDLLSKIKEPNIKTLPTKSDDLENINATMAYIQSNKDINTDNQLGAWMAQAMRKAIGDMSWSFKKNGMETDYWVIDNQWDGNEASLISHVKWKKYPTDPTAQKRLEAITKSKWGSKELHQKHLKDSHHSGFMTNMLENHKGLNIDESTRNKLEGLMNSSMMWEFITDNVVKTSRRARGGNFSDDVNDAWGEMFQDIKDFIDDSKGNLQQSDLDVIIRMLHNPSKYTIDEVKNFLDDTIKKYLGE